MRYICFAATIGVLSLPATAFASPWTLPQGDIVVTGVFDYQFATTEFRDESGTERSFPLNGRFAGASYYLGVRAGLIDRLELEFQIPVRLLSYDADPVLLIQRPAGSPLSEYDYYQENVIDLSRNKVGIGDLTIAGSYQLLAAPLAIAAELRFEAPTGYDGPVGTFGEQPTTREQFIADPPQYVRPENVQDDVTLGDGVLTIQPGIQIGAAFPSRTFVRLDLAYRLRVPSAGHQLGAAFKVGQFILPWLLVYAESRFVYSVTEGRNIGISVAAIDPDLPAEQYGGLTNLELREVTLDRDALDVGGGILVRLSESLETVIGYTRTVWGRNTAATNSVFFGMALRTDLRDDPPPEEAEEVYEEEVYEEEVYEEEIVEEPVAEPPNPAVESANTGFEGRENPPPADPPP